MTIQLQAPTQFGAVKKTSDEIAKVDDKVIETIANPTELDANKYIKNGFYSIGDATKRTNLPMQNVGTLLVYYAGYYVIQEYILNANLRRFMRRSTDKGANWSAWQELATMDKVVPSDNYSTITKSIELTRRTKTYIFKDVNTSKTKRYFELNVNGNLSHSGEVFFRKYVGLLYLYPWTGASRGLYLEQVQHIGMTVISTQIDIAYGWDENGVYIQNNGVLDLPIDIVAPSSWFVN